MTLAAMSVIWGGVRERYPDFASAFSRIGRRLDSAVARPYGPAFRMTKASTFPPEDTSERALPAQLLDLVRAGRRKPLRLGRLYRPAQDHVGDRLSALGGFFPGTPQMIRERLELLSPEARHQVLAHRSRMPRD